MRRPRASLLILGLLSASVGCTTTTDTTTLTATDTVFPTSVTVGPQVFLGQVPCSSEAGALRSYVATLTDVTPGGAGLSFDLPSSPPIPCSNRVVFRYIVADHRYQAAIDGYDIAAAELTPLSPGARTMLRRKEMTPVAPRWKASCKGVDGAGLLTTQDQDVPFTEQDCAPFPDELSSVTGIKVDPRASLGLLACGGKGGIVRFDITPGAPAPGAPVLPPVSGVACDADAIEYAQAIPPDVTYTFALVGYTTEGAKLGASCVARTRAGLTVAAVCDPLAALSP
jgi:hypothetical protein